MTTTHRGGDIHGQIQARIAKDAHTRDDAVVLDSMVTKWKRWMREEQNEHVRLQETIDGLQSRCDELAARLAEEGT